MYLKHLSNHFYFFSRSYNNWVKKATASKLFTHHKFLPWSEYYAKKYNIYIYIYCNQILIGLSFQKKLMIRYVIKIWFNESRFFIISLLLIFLNMNIIKQNMIDIYIYIYIYDRFKLSKKINDSVCYQNLI